MCDDDRIPEDPDEIAACNEADDWIVEQMEKGKLDEYLSRIAI